MVEVWYHTLPYRARSVIVFYCQYALHYVLPVYYSSIVVMGRNKKKERRDQNWIRAVPTPAQCSRLAARARALLSANEEKRVWEKPRHGRRPLIHPPFIGLQPEGPSFSLSKGRIVNTIIFSTSFTCFFFLGKRQYLNWGYYDRTEFSIALDLLFLDSFSFREYSIAAK